MAEKLKDIKETASDAVEIIRELGSPEVQESLEKVRETAKTAKEIIESLSKPEMVQNIDNIRRIADSMESTSSKMESITMELKNSGILGEAKGAIASAKNAFSSVGDSKNMDEMVDAVKEMLRSISGLTEELRLTILASKQSGIIHNAEEAVREARKAFAEGK